MKSLLKNACFGAFRVLTAPFRWNRILQRPATMDAATYAAMVAEAERIASPYTHHMAAKRGVALSEELGGDFPEVDALLQRAGIVI